MMAKFVITKIVIIWLLITPGQAQPNYPDSIRHLLSQTLEDTSRFHLIIELARHYQFSRPDSAILFCNQALDLVRISNIPQDQAAVLQIMALAHRNLGNDPIALQINLKALKIAEEHNRQFIKALILGQLAMINNSSAQYDKSIPLLKEARQIQIELERKDFQLLSEERLIETYAYMNEPDSFNRYREIGLQHVEELDDAWIVWRLYYTLGNVALRKRDYLDALEMLHMARKKDAAISNQYVDYSLAILHFQFGNIDSSRYYVNYSLANALQSGYYKEASEGYQLLSKIHEHTDPALALEFSKLAISYRDSLTILAKRTALDTFINFDEQERERDLEIAKEQFQNQLRTNAFLGSSFTLIVIAVLLYRNNRVQKKSKRSTEIAYERLKNTQSQLIQSEKMASLGELTAGIAHEIQNPLNFVNNFSEVNEELLNEMKDELGKGKIEDAVALANDAIENQKKIYHHGQRADAIVKGMLQHSRGGNDVKEPTDLNALADKYLRLAYHGLRAKDKSFNATMKTDYDEALDKINVVPQDIGRVILNLITNAFYAVSEKAKEKPDKDFVPTVTVSTKRVGKGVEISVSDNGNGIPESVKEKIFQPFFTTKPTGQGTGLGLSMSYDIVKSHGGTISVNSKDGLGSEFIITLITH